MIRQAHTYLVGAVGGATLIALAIVAFALLVSAQVFKDWPIAALGSDDTAAVSSGQEVPAGLAGVSNAASGSRASAGVGGGGKVTRREQAGKDASADPGSLAAAGGGLATADGGRGATDGS